MHRHGYQGRKLQLEAGPRKALVRGLLTSLVMHESITTTEAKAKEIAPQFEKLVTKAKKGDLHNQRQLRSVILTEVAAQKMIYELAPEWKDRNGGYTRIIKIANRRGDNAKMAVIQLVLPENRTVAAKPETKEVKKPAAKKPAVKKAPAKAKTEKAAA
jgi:large subunit ribosomal protein L17